MGEFIAGAAAVTLVGMAGAGLAYRGVYSDAGDRVVSEALVVMDDVLMDIVLAFKANPQGKAIPVDQVVSRPINMKNEYLRVTGDTAQGMYNMRDMRKLTTFGETPEEAVGNSPPHRRSTGDLIKAAVTVGIKIQQLPRGFFTDIKNQAVYRSCVLPGSTGNSSQRSARTALVENVLAPLVVIVVRRLNVTKPDSVVDQESLMQLSVQMKRLMFLGACFFKNLPQTYLRQPPGTLRNRDHPFHRETRLSLAAERLIYSTVMFDNSGSPTSISLRSRCFPQMLELFKMTLRFLVDLYVTVQPRGGQPYQKTLNAVQALRPDRPFGKGSFAPDDLAKGLLQVAETLENLVKTAEVGVQGALEGIIMDRLKTIQDAIPSTEGAINEIQLKNVTVGSIDMNSGQGSVRIRKNLGSLTENGWEINKSNPRKQIKNVSATILNAKSLTEVKDARAVPRKLMEKEIPEEILGFLDRVDETRATCSVIETMLNRTRTNNEATPETNSFLKCYKDTLRGKQTVTSLLDAMNIMVLEIREYLKQSKESGAIVGGESIDMTLQIEASALFAKKLSVIRSCINFMKPMVLVASSPKCYIQGQQAEEIVQRVKEAMKDPLYAKFSREDLQIGRTLTPPSTQVREESGLSKDVQNRVLESFGAKIRRDVDQLLDLNLTKLNAKGVGYQEITQRDYLIRQEFGYVKRTGYTDQMDNVNVMVLGMHLLDACFHATVYNTSKKGYRMYVSTKMYKSGSEAVKLCSDQYEKTLREFFERRGGKRGVEDKKMRNTVSKSWLEYGIGGLFGVAAFLGGAGAGGAVAAAAVAGAAAKGYASSPGFIQSVTMNTLNQKLPAWAITWYANVSDSAYKLKGSAQNMFNAMMGTDVYTDEKIAFLEKKQDYSPGEMMSYLTDADIQSLRFSGFKFSNLRNESLLNEMMGVFTKKVDAYTFMNKGEMLKKRDGILANANAKDYFGAAKGGIYTHTFWPIPVTLVPIPDTIDPGNHPDNLKVLQDDMDAFIQEMGRFFKIKR